MSHNTAELSRHTPLFASVTRANTIQVKLLNFFRLKPSRRKSVFKLSVNVPLSKQSKLSIQINNVS